MTGPDLVSRTTRREFREIAVGTVLRKIDDMWEDEGFQRGPANDLNGDRRSLYQSYLDAVDWSDPAQVRRALRVFEATAATVEAQYRQDAYRLLRRDGFLIREDGEITGVPLAPLRPGLLSNLSDASAIYVGLDRISRALEAGDTALVIGSCKEVVESTAKVVLREVGQTAADKEDLNVLVNKAQRALALDPKSAAAGPDGSDAVKRILGGSQAIAIGLAELRNRGYGTGHGSQSVPTGLGPRHAHLAMNAARLWCELVLETLADPQAPWRRTPP